MCGRSSRCCPWDSSLWARRLSSPTLRFSADTFSSRDRRDLRNMTRPASWWGAIAVGHSCRRRHPARRVAGYSRTHEVWVGTGGEGLVAFDGRGFRQIRAEGPRFRKITALQPLDTGRILIGTEKSGVLVYDGRKLKPFHPSLADLPVTALTGNDASLWVGTLDRGLLHWKAGGVETIDALPDRQILSLDRKSV